MRVTKIAVRRGNVYLAIKMAMGYRSRFGAMIIVIVTIRNNKTVPWWLGSGHIILHSGIQHSKAIGPYPTSPNANHAFYEHCQFDCLKIWMGKRHKKAHTQCLRLIDFQGVVYEKPTESNNHVGQNAMVSYNVCLIFFHRKWYQSGDSAPSYAPILDDGPEDPCLLSLLQHRRGAAKNSAAVGVYCWEKYLKSI